MGGGPGGPPGGGPPGGPHRGLGSVESDEIQVPDKMVGLSTYYTIFILFILLTKEYNCFDSLGLS